MRLIILSSLLSVSPSLTHSDSLIGAQLTGFLLGEQEPCGPSASSHRMNRCPAPRRLPASHQGSWTHHSPDAAQCSCCSRWLNPSSFIVHLCGVFTSHKRGSIRKCRQNWKWVSLNLFVDQSISSSGFAPFSNEWTPKQLDHMNTVCCICSDFCCLHLTAPTLKHLYHCAPRLTAVGRELNTLQASETTCKRTKLAN